MEGAADADGAEGAELDGEGLADGDVGAGAPPPHATIAEVTAADKTTERRARIGDPKSPRRFEVRVAYRRLSARANYPLAATNQAFFAAFFDTAFAGVFAAAGLSAFFSVFLSAGFAARAFAAFRFVTAR